MIIEIRITAKTDDSSYRIIQYNTDTQKIHCDCVPPPWEWCAHVDAALVAGERFMVHPDDREKADIIMAQMPPLTPPDGWKGSWRRNKEWRGLPPTPRRAPKANDTHAQLGEDLETYNRRPTVCFTGQFEIARGEMVKMAHSHGWRETSSVTQETMIVVASDPDGTSNKIRAARMNGISILSYTEWLETMETGEIHI
ncbi:MAG: BRCT domain-containing protein [Sphingobium sp.]|nr:BRCT domain-containing protein [Sphingobium sp.]